MKFKYLIASSFILGACANNSIPAMSQSKVNSYEGKAKTVLNEEISRNKTSLASKGIRVVSTKDKGCRKYNGNPTFMGQENYSSLSVYCKYDMTLSFSGKNKKYTEKVTLFQLDPASMVFKSKRTTETLQRLSRFTKADLVYIDAILHNEIQVGMPESLLNKIRVTPFNGVDTITYDGRTMKRYYFKSRRESVYVLNGKVYAVRKRTGSYL